MPALDCYAVGMDIVQPEQVVVDRIDTVGAVTNYFRVNIVVSRKREANGAPEHIRFAARGCTVSHH